MFRVSLLVWLVVRSVASNFADAPLLAYFLFRLHHFVFRASFILRTPPRIHKHRYFITQLHHLYVHISHRVEAELYRELEFVYVTHLHCIYRLVDTLLRRMSACWLTKMRWAHVGCKDYSALIRGYGGEFTVDKITSLRLSSPLNRDLLVYFQSHCIMQMPVKITSTQLRRCSFSFVLQYENWVKWKMEAGILALLRDELSIRQNRYYINYDYGTTCSVPLCMHCNQNTNFMCVVYGWLIEALLLITLVFHYIRSHISSFIAVNLCCICS